MILDRSLARGYLRLLVARHVAILAGLAGFCLLVTDAPSAIRSLGAMLFIAGAIGFVLTVSALVVPLVLAAIPEQERSLTTLLATTNQFTGHLLVDEATALTGRSWPSRRALRTMVVIEIILFALVPVIAALSH